MTALAFTTVLSTLLTGIRAALVAVPGTGGDVTVSCVVPGDIAVDTCDCDGSLWASLHAQYFGDSLLESSMSTSCDAAWLIGDCEIMIARCAPNPEEGQVTVPCTALAAGAQEVNADAWAVLSSLACLLQNLEDTGVIIDFLLGRQRIVGPSGGCVGSSVSFSIAVARDYTS